MKNHCKKGGFTLIELVVAVALIGILSTLVTPKVRSQLAKGKDSRAISLIGAMRTASELYYIEKGEAPLSDLTDGANSAKVKDAINKLKDYLDPKANDLLKDGKVQIGGSRKATSENGTQVAGKDITYGGEIEFTFINPDTSATDRCDGIYMWFAPASGKEYDTAGNLWELY